MADGRLWPALVLRGTAPGAPAEDDVAALLDDASPIAIEDLTALPLPPGGLWDPTFPPPPEPPPAPLHWRVFFNTPFDRARAAAALDDAFPHLAVSAEDVPDQDWAARSQRELTAVRAGSFVVAPPWALPDTVAHGDTLIVIEPSRGFGTGHHQSTRLCLRAMSGVDFRGKTVLDLGTGSGVLAMAATMRGARRVLAVDVDQDAIDAARESQALNPAAGAVEWLVADFRDRGAHAEIDAAWDIVLANLTGGMLRSSAMRLCELVAPGGLLITSGFDEHERADVQSAFQLDRLAAFTEDSWVGLVLQR